MSSVMCAVFVETVLYQYSVKQNKYLYYLAEVPFSVDFSASVGLKCNLVVDHDLSMPCFALAHQDFAL